MNKNESETNSIVSEFSDNETSNYSEVTSTCTIDSNLIIDDDLKSDFELDFNQLTKMEFTREVLSSKDDDGKTKSLEYTIGMTTKEFIQRYGEKYNIFEVLSNEGRRFHIFELNRIKKVLRKDTQNLMICEKYIPSLKEYPMFFDIDADLSKLSSGLTKEKFLKYIVQKIKKTIISKYNIDDDFKYDITVFDSSRENKYSFHIIIHINVKLEILGELINYFNKEINIPSLDMRVYRGNRVLRCVNTYKIKEVKTGEITESGYQVVKREIIKDSIKRRMKDKHYRGKSVLLSEQNNYPIIKLKSEYQDVLDSFKKQPKLEMNISMLMLAQVDVESLPVPSDKLTNEINTLLLVYNQKIFNNNWIVRNILFDADKQICTVVLDKKHKSLYCCICETEHDNENFYMIFFNTYSFKSKQCYLKCRRNGGEMTRTINFYCNKYTWRDYLHFQSDPPRQIDVDLMLKTSEDKVDYIKMYCEEYSKDDDDESFSKAIFYKFPMGYGKTDLIFNQLEKSHKNEQINVLYISYRVLLALQVFQSAFERGYTSYLYSEDIKKRALKRSLKNKQIKENEDNLDDTDYINFYVYQFESLYKCTENKVNFDYVIIDECVSLAQSSFCSGLNKPLENLGMLRFVVSNGISMFLDANINPNFIDKSLEVFDFNEDEIEVKYGKYVEGDRNYNKPCKVYSGKQKDIVKLVNIKLQGFKNENVNGKIAINLCSCKLTKKIYNLYKDNEDIEVTVINGDDSMKVGNDFMFALKKSDLNVKIGNIEKPQIFIYNGSMLAGVSITEEFDYSITFLDGTLLNIHDYVQLAGRIRNSKEYIFMVGNYRYDIDELTYKKQKALNISNLKGDYIQGNDIYFDYALSVGQSFDNINNLHHLLTYNGYLIEFGELDLEGSEEVKLPDSEIESFEYNLWNIINFYIEKGDVFDFRMRTYLSRYEKHLLNKIKNSHQVDGISSEYKTMIAINLIKSIDKYTDKYSTALLRGTNDIHFIEHMIEDEKNKKSNETTDVNGNVKILENVSDINVNITEKSAFTDNVEMDILYQAISHYNYMVNSKQYDEFLERCNVGVLKGVLKKHTFTRRYKKLFGNDIISNGRVNSTVKYMKFDNEAFLLKFNVKNESETNEVEEIKQSDSIYTYTDRRFNFDYVAYSQISIDVWNDLDNRYKLTDFMEISKSEFEGSDLINKHRASKIIVNDKLYKFIKDNNAFKCIRFDMIMTNDQVNRFDNFSRKIDEIEELENINYNVYIQSCCKSSWNLIDSQNN